MRQGNVRRRTLLVIAALTAVSGAVVWQYRRDIFDTRLTVRTYRVETDKVTAPVRLAVLSDLHSCAYGAGQTELMNALEALAPQPDALLLAGDIVDDELPEENAWSVVSQISEIGRAHV